MRGEIVGLRISLSFENENDPAHRLAISLTEASLSYQLITEDDQGPAAYFLSSPSKTLSLLSSPALPISGSVAGAPSSSVYD